MNDRNSTNRCRFWSQSGGGGMMKTLLIDVDPQGSGGSDSTAGTPQQGTDYYVSYKCACDVKELESSGLIT